MPFVPLCFTFMIVHLFRKESELLMHLVKKFKLLMSRIITFYRSGYWLIVILMFSVARALH